MIHDSHITEGIVLRVIPFRNTSQIVTLFTKDAGLIKVFYTPRKNNRCTPLTKVELLYRERDGEIFSCHEMSPLDFFQDIRKELAYIQTASELIEILQNTQWIGKKAPRLYSLLCFYMNKVSTTSNLLTLVSSFKLKQLLHDGLIHLPFLCSVCGVSLCDEAFNEGQDMRCDKHALPHQTKWSKEELDVLLCLTFSESYKLISQIPIEDTLKKKIDILSINLLA